MNQSKAFDKLKEQFEQNPLQTLLVGSMTATALSKLLSAFSEHRRTRIYDREVARREYMTGKRGRR